MKFHVCGLKSLIETISSNKITHVLSLIEPEIKIDLSKCWNVQDHKTINFHDVWDKNHKHCPTIEQCQEILDWGKTLPEDVNVLVHCFAGISRSTCATLALMYQYKYEDGVRDAVLKASAKELRPIAFPNTLMAEYFDQLFVSYGAFKREVDCIRENSPFLLTIKEVK